MLITDLLEELQKHEEEEIEFIVFDKGGNQLQTLMLFICDKQFIYKQKDANGNWTNSVVLGLIDA